MSTTTYNKAKVIVWRLEDGSRQDYYFRSMPEALKFIAASRKHREFEIYKV